MDNRRIWLHAIDFYGVHQLTIPPVPMELQSQVLKTSDGVYATFENARSPYDYHWYLEYVLTKETGDFAVFGYAGHGVQSNALHLYVKRGKLVLLLQHSWNNLPGEHSSEFETVAKDYLAASQLLEDSWTHPKLSESSVLIMMYSTLRRERKWAWYSVKDTDLFWINAPIGCSLATMIASIEKQSLT